MLSELANIGLAHPAVRFGRVRAACREHDPTIVAQQLGTIALYLAHGRPHLRLRSHRKGPRPRP